MINYIHELPDWPKFRWSEQKIAARLAGVRHRQGRLIGRMEGLGFQLQSRGDLANPHGRDSKIQRDRRRNPRQGAGAFIDCPSPWHGHRGADAPPIATLRASLK